MSTPIRLNNLQERTPKKPDFINGFHKIKLAYYPFVSSDPKATLIFYHGGCAWSMGIYQKMAHDLSEKYGVATYLFDMRGHGNSHGARGHTPTKEHMWHDVDTAIEFVKKTHPNLPLFLGGHSSGSGLIINHEKWKKETPNVTGHVYVAPFLGGDSGTVMPLKKEDQIKFKTRTPFVKHVRTWAILANILTGEKLLNWLPTVFFNYSEEMKKNDPHLLQRYTAAMTLATSPRKADVFFKNTTKPFCLFIGQDEEQLNPDKVAAFGHLAQHVVSKSIIEILPHATHLSIVSASVDHVGQFINSMCSQIH